ncbi:MAG: dihydroneopterin aldolase [Moraxella sp.]|nr:dihydroneopterin aldolase [Moraxella sp.]
MNTVFIKDLTIDTMVGVYDWERAIKQRLIIDVELSCDMNAAFISDDVADAINYKSVCEDIERLCHEYQAKLLERLANGIIEYLFEHYPCTKISLSIKKPNAIKNAVVGVNVVRTKSVV